VTHVSRPHETSDGDLIVAAQHGNAAALGALLERYRPRLLASALRLVGYRADAEDAVQETFLAAMRHVGTVRDPATIGAWLHTVLRRACLQQRRRQRAEHLTDSPPDFADDSPGPEDRIEQLELRDWIWASLHQLPEALRVTALLRYFGSYTSYAELAAILGIPIGTVRSRLSEARLKLADALLASAGLMDDAAREQARDREQLWSESVREIFRRGTSEPFVSRFVNDLTIGWSDGKVGRGRRLLASEIEGDLEHGVRLEPTRVISSDTIAVVEGCFVNPPEDPEHCPPGIAFVVFGRRDRGTHIRLHIAPRPPKPPHD
jgi:RNA polymerase sigma-70 factor (ECF subfamily)